MNALDVSRMLWDYYLWATVLLMAAIVAMRVIQQPARRVAIAWATAGGLLVLVLLATLPNWSRYSLVSPTPSVRNIVEQNASVAIAVPEVEVIAQRDIQAQPLVEPAAGQTGKPFDWQSLVLTVLAAGSLAVIGWLALGSWQARRLRARSSAVPPEVAELFAKLAPSRQQQIELGVNRELPVAVALGLQRPCILLPQTLVDQASAGQLRSVLAHELAHVEHRDLWLLAILRLLSVVLWLHPLFWLLKRQVRHDQEVLADTAAAALTTRVDYAEQLVALARSAVETRIPRLASSVGLWEKRTQLTERIKLLLDEKLTILRNCSRGWRLGSAGMLAALALGLSLVTLSPRIAQSRAETETANNATIASVSPEEFAKLLQQADTKEGFADSVGDLIVAAIRPSQLPFMDEQRLAGIREQFVGFVNQHLPAGISAKRKAQLLRGLRDHAREHLQLPDRPYTRHSDLNNVYLNFANRIKTLQWELWMALTRGPLDEAAIAELETQRNWMRETISQQPKRPHFTHEQVLTDLDAKFADPLCVIFDRPMSGEQFAKFQTAINKWLAGEPEPNSTQTETDAVNAATDSRLPYMVHHLFVEAMNAQYAGERGQYNFTQFDHDENSGYGVGGSYLTLGFVSHRAQQGPTLNLPSIETEGPGINAETGFYAESRSPEQGGDFAYSSKDRQLVARNGAKLLRLDVLDWIAADAIPTEQLQRDLQAQGTDHVSFPAFMARLREQFIKDFEQGRVDYPYKAAETLEDALAMWESIGPGEGPYVAVLTKEGRVAVVQVQFVSPDLKSENIQVRTRVRSVAAEGAAVSKPTGRLIPATVPAESDIRRSTDPQE
jgi:beta-lactamase regulating signal transducer with metallopeptidase domain